MRRRVSVIITAHDAEARIEVPVRALGAQRLPPDVEMDVIVVDDRSSDDTTARALRAAATCGLALRTLRMDVAPVRPVTARVAALEAGVGASDGDAIVLLDDDASIDATFVASMLEHLARADVVAPPLRHRSASRAASRSGRAQVIAAFQSFDSALYHAISGMVARAGFAPGVCFGGVAFRRDLLVRTGGLASLGFTLVEDLAFARRAHARGARFAFPRRPCVEVNGLSSFYAVVERAVRVSATGGPSVLAAALVIPVATLPLALLLWMTGVAGWEVVAARWIIGGAVVHSLARRRGSSPSYLAALAFEAASIVLAIRLALRARRATTVRWGGIDYARASRAPRIGQEGIA